MNTKGSNIFAAPCRPLDSRASWPHVGPNAAIHDACDVIEHVMHEATAE